MKGFSMQGCKTIKTMAALLIMAMSGMLLGSDQNKKNIIVFFSGQVTVHLLQNAAKNNHLILSSDGKHAVTFRKRAEKQELVCQEDGQEMGSYAMLIDGDTVAIVQRWLFQDIDDMVERALRMLGQQRNV